MGEWTVKVLNLAGPVILTSFVVYRAANGITQWPDLVAAALVGAVGAASIVEWRMQKLLGELIRLVDR